jgi:Na+-translocating ferredoxin:NAD+ oxidoreductase RNF subunit RnfB
MAFEPKDTKRLRKIVTLLARRHCGKCGFPNCGHFAVALFKEEALPTDCRKSLDNLKEICEVLGIEVPENAEAIATEHRRRHGNNGNHHHHHHHHNHGHAHRNNVKS